MNTLPIRSVARFLTVALSLLVATMAATFPAAADVVTLKSGEKIEGKIIAEGTDMVRIEVRISGSIKETKTFGMADIANIEKTAPDKVAFAAIKGNIPTPDLMSSADYDDMIRSSAKRFLTTYPESEHVAEVEAIIKQLEEEKEKVQLGAIKLDGAWISREERQLYRFAVEGRIRHNRMKSKMASKDILGALRDFEMIEERYQETPAHAAALGSVLSMLPAWGKNLERQLSNVKFLNERDEALAKNLKADELAQIEQAKVAEQARFNRALENEKSQGILWTSVNFRSADSLENGISLAQTQLTRLKAIDAAALQKEAEILTDANRLVGEGKLTAARGKVAEASGARSSKKPRRSSSKSKDPVDATRYSQWLLGQISAKDRELAAAAKDVADAKKNGTATIVPDKDDEKPDAESAKEMADKKVGEGEDEGKPEGAGKGEAKQDAKPKTRAEIVAAERARNEARKAAEGSDKGDDKKSKPKRPAPKESDDDEDKDEEDEPAKASSGGGFSPKYIIWGIAGLLIIALVVMKVMGIGGGSAGGGSAGGGSEE